MLVYDFDKISVNDICEEALVSRSTFYKNYIDKYDLLRSYLQAIRQNIRNKVGDFDDIQYIHFFVDFVFDNLILLKHILIGSNTELIQMFVDITQKGLYLKLQKIKNGDRITEQDEILLNFFSGGVTYILVSQLEKGFPIGKEAMFNVLAKTEAAVSDMK